MKKTLAITILNESGILTKVSNIFFNKYLNIESIVIGSTKRPLISKILITLEILVLPGKKDAQQSLDQIMEDLKKIVQVIEIICVGSRLCLELELMLIKVELMLVKESEIILVRSKRSKIKRIIEVVKIFYGKIVDISENSITIEIIGNGDKCITIQQVLKYTTIIEVVRTNAVSADLELIINAEFLNTF